MTITVNKQELHDRLDELVAIAQSGTEVIVDVPGARRVRLIGGEIETPSPQNGIREWKVGLHPGAMVLSDDFNDEITDEDFLKGTF